MLIRSIYENTAYLANDTFMVRSLRIAERLHVGEREPGYGHDEQDDEYDSG